MAYRAEIEIGVKGTEKLRELRNTIEDISKRVNKLDELANTFQAPIQSVLNYTKAVQQATAALDKAEMGTRDETEALQAAARAITQENTARQRKLFLLDTEIRKQQGILRAAPTSGTIELGPGGPGFSGGFTAAQRQAANEQATLRVRQEENKIRRQNLDILSREELFELRLQKILERNALLEKQRQTARAGTREAASNAIIGGAFPLLFGQGVGAAAGGGLGGAIGGAAGGSLGFGLSLVGTAVGSTFDKAIQSATDFAKALRGTGNAVQSLENLLGSLDPATATLITNLQASGQTAKAAEVTFQKLADTIGKENAKALEDAGNGWDKFTKRLGSLLTEISANVIRTFKEIRRQVPDVGGLVGFIGGLGLEGEKVKPAAALTPEAAQRLSTLQKETEILRTQAGLGTLSLKNSLDQFVLTSNRLAQQEFLTQQADIEYKAKIGQVSSEERLLLLTQARLKLQADLNNVARQRIEELRRRQEEAARSAEQAQQKAQQNLLAQLSVENSIFTEQLKRVNLNVQQLEFLGGEKAALERSLALFNTRVRISEELLSAERDKALIEARTNGTVQQTLKLYENKRKNLQIELDLQNKLEARRLAQIKVEEQLAAARREQAIEDVALPIQRRQEEVRIGIASFGQTEQVTEQQRQNLEQRLRLQEAEAPILREIAALQTEINGGGLVGRALEAKEADLDASQRKLGVLREELTLLDQLEQRQLRLQQFFATYGQLIQSVSGEIANAVTFGVSEMVRGTKTAEQVFADFLNAVGNALMQAAQTMIAQYIAIGIAKLFAGLGGGGGGGGGNYSGAFSSTPGTSFADALKMPSLRAGGGPVAGGAPYLVGERGPELFVPGSSGGVMSNNDLRQSMNGGGSPVLNMSFETTRFGDTEYVSRDQLEAAMSETRRQASRDGAQRGMTMTLDRIQNSSATRRRIGV